MTYEPIGKLEIECYGCIRKASFTFSPLHALIGPNDSGKTTTLRALRTAAQFAAGQFERRDDIWGPFNPIMHAKRGTNITLRYSDGLGYRLRYSPDPLDVLATGTDAHLDFRESILGPGNEEEVPRQGEPRRGWNVGGLVKTNASQTSHHLKQRITPATMVRFDPSALRLESPQIPAIFPVRFLDETGAGLSGVLQAINTRDVDAFVRIRDRIRNLFPSVADVQVPTGLGSTVLLLAKLVDGTVVPAEQLSDGLLYSLAFEALSQIQDCRLFLVEEPENGLHPARIAEIMGVLREISKRAQVIVATHSPLVVNELQGNEVTVVTRDPERGTQAELLENMPGYEDAMKVYRPGEFWLSYSDGRLEEPLRKGTPRT